MGILNTSRLNNLKKAYRAGELDRAYEYAVKLNLAEVRTAYDLTMIAEVYVANQKYVKATEIYIAVFNKNSSASVCKTIIDLCIKIHDVKTALSYMRELKEIDEENPEIYLYEYRIGKIIAQPDEYLIECLKKYKEVDYVDRWALELAKLYYKNDMIEECLTECRSIKLWFADTPLARKAEVLIDACKSGRSYGDMLRQRNSQTDEDDLTEIFGNNESYESGLDKEDLEKYMDADEEPAEDFETKNEDILVAKTTDLEEFESSDFDGTVETKDAKTESENVDLPDFENAEFEGPDFEEDEEPDCDNGDIDMTELQARGIDISNLNNEVELPEMTDLEELDFENAEFEGLDFDDESELAGSEDNEFEQDNLENGEIMSDNSDIVPAADFDDIDFESIDFDKVEFEGPDFDKTDSTDLDEEAEDEVSREQYIARHVKENIYDRKTERSQSGSHEMTEISFDGENPEADEDIVFELSESVQEVLGSIEEEGETGDEELTEVGKTIINDTLTHDVIRALKEQESGKAEEGRDLVDEAIQKMIKEDDDNE